MSEAAKDGLLIWVCQSGSPAFVYRIEGDITSVEIEEIESQLEEDAFSTDGSYRCAASYQPPQTDNYGNVELPDYWEISILEIIEQFEAES